VGLRTALGGKAEESKKGLREKNKKHRGKTRPKRPPAGKGIKKPKGGEKRDIGHMTFMVEDV